MRYLADAALVDDKIEPHVLIEIGAGGTIVSVTPQSTEPAERLPGLVVPGMPNLHSHAFQRAMAGLTERAGPDGDNFWRWREVMYRFLAMLTPDDVEAIAAQLYVECLLHGYTSVAEFHYLHNAPDGLHYADPAELAHRIVAAAQSAGIGLTLLPVLYRRSQFGGAPPTEGQRRFVLSARRICRPVRDDGAQRRHRHRTAFAARGYAGGAACSHQHRGRQADPHPRRRTGTRRWPTVLPGAVRDRSPGCSTLRRSISVGAWCMRRT